MSPHATAGLLLIAVALTWLAVDLGHVLRAPRIPISRARRDAHPGGGEKYPEPNPTDDEGARPCTDPAPW